LCNILIMHRYDGESTNSNAAREDDWRQAVIDHINDHGCTRDRKIRRQALKYTVINEGLYRRTIEYC
jgi:hypothetical protein